MTDLTKYLQVIVEVGVLLAAVIWAFVSWRKGTANANADSLTIYEALNKALKEEVATLKAKLDEAVARIEATDKRVTQMADDLSFYERIFLQALQDYFVEHPDLPREHIKRLKGKKVT